MRDSKGIVAFATAAAVTALIVAGCKYSNSYPPLPYPSPITAPTFPPGVVFETPIPTANATPFGITAGKDGNVWFAENAAGKIGRIVPSTMAITEFPLLPNSQPIDVTQGPNGNNNIWFDEYNASRIGFITPGGSITEFQLNSVGPVGLTADPTGNLWFAEFNVAKIGEMTTGGVLVGEFPISYSGGGTTPQPDSVVVAPDHTIWFLDPANNVVVHMQFPGPTFTPYSLLTSLNNPQDIVVGGDGNLWFTELGNPSLSQGCRIGRVNLGPSPTITEFLLPTPQNAPYGDWCIGITKGSDGNVWFAETAAGTIGRIKPNGSVTEWGVPGAGTTAVGVANGPDGNLWFTDGNAPGLAPGFIGTNQIGKVLIGLLPAYSVHKQFVAKSVTHGLIRVPEHGVFPRTKRP